MDSTEFSRLLKKGEGVEIEFKQQFTPKAIDMAKEMAAFANTQGGVIVVGIVDKTHEVIGVLDPDKTMERLAGAARSICKPALNPSIDKLQYEEKWIVWAKISRQRPPISVEDRYYVRIGSTVQVASATELEELFFRNTGGSEGSVRSVDRPREFMYFDEAGINRLYSQYVSSSRKDSRMTSGFKLQEVMKYLSTVKGIAFFDNLPEAIDACSKTGDGAFVHVVQKFDAPQFVLHEDGLAEVNSSGRVVFMIGFVDPYDYSDDYYKHPKFDERSVIMYANVNKFAYATGGKLNKHHDAPYFIRNRGRDLALSVFGYLLPESEFFYQIKPYTIQRVGPVQ